MTDQTIPADAVREIAAAMRAAMRRDEHAYPEAKFLADLSGYIKDLEALLPPRPTLADMSVEERAACRWMQADVKPGVRLVITAPNATHARAALLDEGGEVTYQYHAHITPRPDLPRLEWPGDTPAPAPAALTVGSEWGDIHALTDACRESGRDQIVVTDCEGDVSVWDVGAGGWEVVPSDGYEPYTIIHTGKKAGQ